MVVENSLFIFIHTKNNEQHIIRFEQQHQFIYVILIFLSLSVRTVNSFSIQYQVSSNNESHSQRFVRATRSTNLCDIGINIFTKYLVNSLSNEHEVSQRTDQILNDKSVFFILVFVHNESIIQQNTNYKIIFFIFIIIKHSVRTTKSTNLFDIDIYVFTKFWLIHRSTSILVRTTKSTNLCDIDIHIVIEFLVYSIGQPASNIRFEQQGSIGLYDIDILVFTKFLFIHCSTSMKDSVRTTRSANLCDTDLHVFTKFLVYSLFNEHEFLFTSHQLFS
ncbi:unnamed protein product [Rotaria socialis]|uniref:Uncharacterized protein n=2 Tax=Rotaria socialis TaxID=392032 RepID=A0A818SWK9_9BILA|nr:unnamed protein product [Rotaria socialis]